MKKKFYIVDKKTNEIMAGGYDTALIAKNASSKYTWFNPKEHEVAYGESAGSSNELIEDAPKDEYLGFYIVNHDTFVASAGPYDSYDEAQKHTNRLAWYQKAPNDYSILHGTIDDEHNFDEVDE